MKVLLGLSGGVDSAVAGKILIDQGFEVTALFMRNWDSAINNDYLGNPTLTDDICPQEDDYNDALKVADQLGIELLRQDYIKEYWDLVFKKFIDEYEKGRTPNPDILCNKYIKFDTFYDYAKEHGFDALATGHYVKKVEHNDGFALAKADDLNKDQSYFLSEISNEAMKYSIFPLGNLTKPEVRKIAADMNLAVADKKDSTGVCFIGERDFRLFLSNYIPMKEGNIIDVDTGKVIGTHNGVYYYTIGQRKGFHVGGNRGPYYCVGKDVIKNELYLSSHLTKSFLASTSCTVTGFNNQLNIDLNGLDLKAKFRYRQKDNDVHVISYDGNDLLLSYDNIEAVSPGQEAVLYTTDGIMIGGGTIDKRFIDGSDVDKLIKDKLNNL